MRGGERAVEAVEDRRLLAIGLVLLAGLCFTGIDSSAKWLLTSGMPSFQVVFARYAVSLLLLLALLLPARGPALFRSNNLRLEIWRAVALLMSTLFNFIALTYLPLTVTGSIMFAMPLILSMLAVPLLGEHVGWRRWLAITIGFVGVLTIMQPGGDSFHWAALMALVATTSYALYNIATRKLAGVDRTDTQQVYAALVATVGVTPFLLGGWSWPQDVAGWFALGMMGVFASVGHFLITAALRMAPASVLAPFVYPQILFLTASSWLIFNQPPDAAFFLGAPIIVGAGLFIWLRERQIAVRERREGPASRGAVDPAGRP